MIDKEISEDMDQSISKFETDLNISPGFYKNLLHEDDWSFIIKLSALLETSSTDVLTKVLGYRELEGATRPKLSKLQFLK